MPLPSDYAKRHRQDLEIIDAETRRQAISESHRPRLTSAQIVELALARTRLGIAEIVHKPRRPRKET